ncbi:MAG: hypothetical protein JNL38_34935 [Myxococcales bacterium]|nr:hypothetical protein [Myxococcales bacterium]
MSARLRPSALAAPVAILLGLALALGAAVLLGARAPRALPAPLSARAATADDVGPLSEVMLHWLPEEEAAIEATYRGFLTTLPAEVRVTFVIPRGREAALRAFVRRIAAGGELAASVSVVELDIPIGIWSRDRALVLAGTSADPRPTLLVPPRPRAGEASRPQDWDIVPAVARAAPDRYQVRALPFAFDGGDFAVAGGRVIVDDNLFTRNKGRGARSPEELRARVAAALGREVVMLGAAEGDVPRHHMGMYMAPVGGGVALVGDPAAGEAIVGAGFTPGERSPETGAALRADASPEVVARFDRAARDLAAAGFRVVRVPTVAFDDRTYFAYTNAIYETRGGARTAWMPTYGVPALDDAARRVHEGLGFQVHPVDVRAVYARHGTLGCLVNVVARGRSGRDPA